MALILPASSNELSETARRSFGIDGDWNFGILRETNWSDVDGNLHVNNLTFLEWCQEARTRYFRDVLGHWPEPSRRSLVVRALSFSFERGLNLGDRAFVTARTSRIKTTSCVQRYAVWHGGLIGEGEAVCVFIDPSSGSKSPIDEDLRRRIKLLDPHV
jgi:acyl-CoA thioester hydrolase